MLKENKNVVVCAVILIVSVVAYLFFRKDINEIIKVKKARKMCGKN
jgi:hypothetical protein